MLCSMLSIMMWLVRVGVGVGECGGALRVPTLGCTSLRVAGGGQHSAALSSPAGRGVRTFPPSCEPTLPPPPTLVYVCLQAIYVPADDLTDPAPATTFAHLDATTVLSRGIAGGPAGLGWAAWVVGSCGGGMAGWAQLGGGMGGVGGWAAGSVRLWRVSGRAAPRRSSPTPAPPPTLFATPATHHHPLASPAPPPPLPCPAPAPPRRAGHLPRGGPPGLHLPHAQPPHPGRGALRK